MPVIHNYTDKENRKFKIQFALYILAFGAIAILGLLSRKPKTQDQDTTQNSSETNYVCFASNLSTDIVEQIDNLDSTKDLKTGAIGIDSPCKISIVRNIEDINDFRLLRENVYFLVSRFDGDTEEISEAALLNSLTSQIFGAKKILWDSEIDTFLHSRLNIGVGQKVSKIEEIHKELKENTNSLAIVTLEEIKPYYRIIEVGGIDPMNPEHSLNTYVLSDKYWISGDQDTMAKLLEEYKSKFLQTNFDQSKLSSLVITGSSQIDGEIKVGESLKNLLISSDVTQLNNETSVVDGCQANVSPARKCTLEENLNILRNLQIDALGVNGNHIMDYGRDTYIETLLKFKKDKQGYYGGGINELEAHTPLEIEIDKFKIAFLGYNLLYPYSYYSAGNTAGSANVSELLISEDLKRTKADYIFVDVGWGYDTSPNLAQSQIDYEQILRDLGVKFIFGSNPQVIQNIYIYEDGISLFGLGIFIPSETSSGSHDSFIARFIFYDGKYLGFDLIPIYINDRSMNLAEGENKDRIMGTIHSLTELK